MVNVSLLLLLTVIQPSAIRAFTLVPTFSSHAVKSISPLALPVVQSRQQYVGINNILTVSMKENDDGDYTSRRQLLCSVSKIGSAMLVGIESLPHAALSDDTTTTPIAMKTFVDPEGFFIINIPQRFFAIRRTNQGDLPNAATGSGRRGSSIFKAGDLAKAEVLAIERYVPACIIYLICPNKKLDD